MPSTFFPQYRDRKFIIIYYTNKLKSTNLDLVEEGPHEMTDNIMMGANCELCNCSYIIEFSSAETNYFLHCM